MKYLENQILFCRLDGKNQKGRKVITAEDRHGRVFYKFESKETDIGFVWSPEWMLYTESEFVTEVKEGKLLAMQLDN